MSAISGWLLGMRTVFPRSVSKRGAMRNANGRQLGIEPLERRTMLAANSMGVISGTIFQDHTGDGLTADDTFPPISVELFQDGGDGVPGGDDVSLGTDTTDANGNYEFSGLGEGRYFVQQTRPANLIAGSQGDSQTVDISAQQAAGTSGLVIDEFDTDHEATAAVPGAAIGNSEMDDGNVLGGERDLQVEVDSGSGNASLESGFQILLDGIPENVLQFESSGPVIATATVTWDGDDDDGGATLDPIGLRTGGNGVDLTTEGGDLMTAFSLIAGADQEGAMLTIQVFTDANNSSIATMEIPDTNAIPITGICIHFEDNFQVADGNGADFTNVGAIVMSIASDTESLDASVALTGTVGPSVFDVDFANAVPHTLGDLVWSDADNDGMFDAGSEAGVENVTVNLYASDGVSGFDPAGDTLVDTTTTDTDGLYTFGDLFPGDYIVQIPQANLDVGGPLAGMTSSTGNDPASDPDDDVNNDDNGTAAGANGVVADEITLSFDDEPIDDGDTNPNTNLTVDFGFFSQVDLEVTKMDDPDPVIAGEQITYTVEVTNNGPAPATGVTIVDTLPAEVTFDQDNAPAGAVFDENSNTVTVNFGNLGVDDSSSVTIFGIVDAGFTGDTITNNAAVSGNEVDSNPNNNTVDEQTTVTAQADLAIAKSDDVDPNTPEQALTYTLDVTNIGPSDAVDVTIVDTLPAGVTFVDVPTAQTFAVNGDEVTIQLGDMPAGAMSSVEIATTVNDDALGQIDNTATVSSTTPDPDNANDIAVEPTTIVPQVDLTISKNESADPVDAGGTLTYTLEVTNNGPSDATGVTVVDTLPDGVSFDSASVPVVENGNELTIDVGNLAMDAMTFIDINVNVGAATSGTITNTASVTANEMESDPADNQASVDTLVELALSSITGFVFVDLNRDGVMNGNDAPVAGATVMLTGTDVAAAMVNRTALTAADGSYRFDDLLPGTYQVQETQPSFFPDGDETVGSAGGDNAVNDVIASIVLAAGVDAVDYNFGELPPTLSKRDFLASSG